MTPIELAYAHVRRVVLDRREADWRARRASREKARQRDYQSGFIEAARND